MSYRQRVVHTVMREQQRRIRALGERARMRRPEAGRPHATRRARPTR